MEKDMLPVAYVDIPAPLYAIGAGMDTSDARIFKDASALGERLKELRERRGLKVASPRLFMAATMGYDRESGAYRYAMGDIVDAAEALPEGFERIEIPAGRYAAFTVRPLLGFLWGPAIGRAYAYIYGAWLPASAWRHAPRPAADGRRVDHFEYHDGRASRRRKPEIEIRVPVEPKA